ncbi:MAG: tripartite tricarboxylate transporter permease, partial [Proteobacteria bacterium]|nr:tripartite tricarboxylate transporter permease [Pseudomonadota bacterium]
FISSMYGGVFGAAVLSVAVFYAIPLILAMGFPEQLMLIVLALTMIGMLTGDNAWKGLFACVMGFMLKIVGPASATADLRLDFLDFGTGYFLDNIKLVIVGLGMFAMPEIIDLLRRHFTISESGGLGEKGGWIQGLKDWGQNWWLSTRCCVIGCIVGALPGLGGSVVDWIAYGHAIQTTDRKQDYGTGDVRGVIAPESANNAKEGGALIPTLLFGIPGSGSMAILLGGFVLIGIEPGVDMVTNQLDLVYLMIWSVGLANVIGAGFCVFFANQIALLTTIRYSLIAPFMMGLIFFAAFQATRHWGDLIMLMLVGSLGVYMKRFGWPRPALLIGFVLSKQVEQGVYETYTVYKLSFLERPIVIGLIILLVLSVIACLRYKPNPPKLTEDGPFTHLKKKPQVIFFAFLVLWVVTLFADSFRFTDNLSTMYPRFVVVLALLLLVPVGFQIMFGKTPGSHFYDSEREDFGDHDNKRSNEYYMMWLVGMLGMCALVGFEIGMAIYIYVFVRLKADQTRLGSFICAASFTVFLGLLAYLLTLEYPKGLLQEFVNIGLDRLWRG